MSHDVTEPTADPTFDEGPPRRVSIRQERLAGPMTMEIEGEDVSRYVRGVHVDLDVAERVPHVLLELSLDATAEGFAFDGVARVAIGEAPDPGPAAAAFLDAIDWEQLEQAALNRPDLEHSPGGLTRAMLRQLTEWASGRP